MKKTIFITGTSSGFGLLTVKTLLQKGYTVIATMRNLKTKNEVVAQEIRSLADEYNSPVYLVDLDITDDESVKSAISEALLKVDHIDVVVNNAGIGSAGLSETFSTSQWQQIFDINVLGTNRVMKAVLPSMRNTGDGLIINVSSIMGRFIIPFAGPYTASKYALEALTETYRYELAHAGIDVLIVEPGGFDTGFGARLLIPEEKERIDSYGEFAKVPEKMWSGMFERIKSNTNLDPQLVADKIVQLIESEPSERPFRSVVDPMNGGQIPNEINNLTENIQKNFFQQMKVNDLFQLKVVEH